MLNVHNLAFNQVNALEEVYAMVFITVGLLLQETEDACYYTEGGVT